MILYSNVWHGMNVGDGKSFLRKCRERDGDGDGPGEGAGGRGMGQNDTVQNIMEKVNAVQ